MAEDLRAKGGRRRAAAPPRAGEAPPFLADGGEMGALMRAFDWHSTPLGAPAGWPQSLKTAVRLLLNSEHPIFIWWGPRLIQFYNDAYRQSIGPERHPSALGQEGEQCWREIWPIIGPQIEQVMSGKGVVWHENALVPLTRNGRLENAYFTYSYGPIDEPESPHGVGGVMVICSETTNAVAVRNKNAQEVENLRRLFAHAPGAVAVLRGREHRFELVNDAYMALVGRRDLIGKTVAEAMPEVIEQGFIGLLDQVYATGQPHIGRGVPISLRRPGRLEADERILDFVYQPVLDEAGQTQAIFAQVTDNTAQKLAEDRLRRWNEELERLVEEKTRERDRAWKYSRDIMLILNRDGILRAANPAWTRILGHAAEEIVGHSLLEFVYPEDTLKTLGGWQAAVAQKQLVNFQNRYVHKEGSVHWISWHTAVENDLVFAYGRDITVEQKQADALALVAEQLRQAQKMEAVGQLTGGIAHDFNNLLTGISGSLALLENQAVKGLVDTSTILKYTSVAQGAARRAAALTHRLLAFSRLQTLAPGPTDVNALMQGMSDLIGRTVGPAITIQVGVEPRLWPVLVDQNQLENALLNLCINARDAMPDGGSLRMATANVVVDEWLADELVVRPGEYVRLSVDDTGVGMAADVMLRAFDPFFTTKPLGEGTGLGLSMIYGFARQSGGQVKITSALGEGTQVAIYLPRHRGDGETEKSAGAQQPGAGHASEGETVLLVDDDDGVRLFVSEVLIEKGCRVIQASVGSEGLDVLRSPETIDLLITDVGLPGGMNGRQVADAARRLRPDLKVLFITGYAENSVWRDGKPPPGMEVLIKPFEMDELAARVDRLLPAKDSGN